MLVFGGYKAEEMLTSLTGKCVSITEVHTKLQGRKIEERKGYKNENTKSCIMYKCS